MGEPEKRSHLLKKDGAEASAGTSQKEEAKDILVVKNQK